MTFRAWLVAWSPCNEYTREWLSAGQYAEIIGQRVRNIFTRFWCRLPSWRFRAFLKLKKMIGGKRYNKFTGKIEWKR